MEECTRCSWRLLHLNRGICSWCESDVTRGGGKVEFRNYSVQVALETPQSVQLMVRRLYSSRGG